MTLGSEKEDILKEREEEISGFLRDMQTMEDTRGTQGKVHSLAEIFLLVLCAQIGGFESLREYEMYGEMKLNLLRKFLPYRHGAPSKSTIGRVLSVFKPKVLESLFLGWMARIVRAYEDQRQVAIDGQETRYFISSLPADARVILRSVRAHWGIESMHWCLDVIFREDDRIIWNRQFAQNESILRRFALNLLKKFQEIGEYRIGNAKVALKTLRKLLVGSDSNMEKLICCAV